MKKIMFICVELSWIAAVVYLFIGAGLIKIPGAGIANALPVIAYLAGVGYAAGGALILTGKRWLWAPGAVASALATAVFLGVYSQNISVLVSLPGLAIEGAQILISAGLVYLVLASSRSENRVHLSHVKHA
jgi:hypothetical protein